MQSMQHAVLSGTAYPIVVHHNFQENRARLLAEELQCAVHRDSERKPIFVFTLRNVLIFTPELSIPNMFVRDKFLQIKISKKNRKFHTKNSQETRF